MPVCPFCNQEIPEGRRRCPVCTPPERGRIARRLSRQIKRRQQVTQVAIVAGIICFAVLVMLIAMKKGG